MEPQRCHTAVVQAKQPCGIQVFVVRMTERGSNTPASFIRPHSTLTRFRTANNGPPIPPGHDPTRLGYHWCKANTSHPWIIQPAKHGPACNIVPHIYKQSNVCSTMHNLDRYNVYPKIGEIQARHSREALWLPYIYRHSPDSGTGQRLSETNLV